jgi:D-sorbitol dehydrogenase (acceptor)
MTTRLANKHALLTGANGGIGLAVAHAYAKQGARCTVVDIADTPSVPLAELIKQRPAHIQYLRADITHSAQIDAMIGTAHRKYGAIQILFNNAAVFDLAPLLESDEAMYDKLFAVNVKGMFFVMQKVLAHMVQHNVQGSVINMASQAGRRGEALVSHYCAT